MQKYAWFFFFKGGGEYYGFPETEIIFFLKVK